MFVDGITPVVKPKLGAAELLYRSAEKMGLNPVWLRPNGLFAITESGEERYVNFARSPLNSHLGISLARNKHLTRLVMARHGMLNIPFMQPTSIAQATSFLKKYQKIVAKPLSGQGATDIHIITAPVQLQTLDITKYILEKYIAGPEMRYLVLDGKVIGVHESRYGVSVESTRALERISYTEDTWDPAMIASSLKIARMLDLKFAAIDYLIDASGQVYVLEVNTLPGLKWFHAPTSGPPVDVAGMFLKTMLHKSA